MFVLSARQTVNWCTDSLIIGIKLSFLKCFRQIFTKRRPENYFIPAAFFFIFNNSKRIIVFDAGTFVLATRKRRLRGILIRLCFPVIRMLYLCGQCKMLQQKLTGYGNLIALKLFSLLLLDFN
jgi:hypothetical protein